MGRIAVIGAGISGLATAELLSRSYDVVLLEAGDRLGGHARTRHVDGPAGRVAVDTGFIVYNEVNYPLLTRFFADLGVATHASDMSFGVTYGDGELEFGASDLKGLFAQPSNALSPRYWGMLFDILRFFRSARGVLDRDGDPTLGEFIDSLGLGSWFKDRFLVPMGAAIWSTPPEQMLGFPAKTFVRFFENHGLLSVRGQHPWRTVTGGSERYVERVAQRLGDRARTNAAVAAVVPAEHGFDVKLANGETMPASEVVFACHADVALRLNAAPTDDERRILGAFGFRDNEAFLHRDASFMPKAKAAWASWVYAAGGTDTLGDVSLTYWMNRLQALPGPDLFVTLNPKRPIQPDLIYDRHTFRHPVFSKEAVAAQSFIPALQGVRGLWYCGAWQRYGFHEDGIWSAVRVATGKGVPALWH